VRFPGAVALFLFASIATAQTGSDVANELRQIKLDPQQTCRVRDLEIVRGDIKVYLSEGTVSFFGSVNHRLIAALFTIEGTEGGDAEVILLPPSASERASLASFIKTPNLDEHFGTALLFFTDNTAQEILDQIRRSPPRPDPEVAAEISDRINPIARNIAEQLEVPLVEALLDNHRPETGILHLAVAGQTVGPFDITYDPTQSESIFVGRASDSKDKPFQLWTNFRPRHSPVFVQPLAKIRQYRLDSTIHSDLGIDVSAEFKIETSAEDGRVLALSLSPRLAVSSATIDGIPCEVLQHVSNRLSQFGSTETFLLVSPVPFTPGVEHLINLRYGGAIIRQTNTGEYFVDERNSWYPVDGPVLADFELTFQCPANLRLVSTGEPVSDTVENGVRTVRRRTATPAVLAGFNLGEYTVRQQEHNRYSIEIDSPKTVSSELTADPTLPEQAASILDHYTRRWVPLPIRNVAVTPIAGYFGQGFPGLIYLSSVSYIKTENRSTALRNSRFDAFFSELLLPHEIAHQWWGNIVRAADYRSGWITEAMANESALEYIATTKGASARDEILSRYRQDLVRQKEGTTIESAGPVDFGQRLIDNFGLLTWQTIIYEKGSWILRMLSERLGAENFRKLQRRLLEEYKGSPLSNEQFREMASSFVPSAQPDKSLASFFDTWIYGTGIPTLSAHSTARSLTVEVSGVADDFVIEIPMHCSGANTYWLRASTGSNSFELPTGISACELPQQRDFLYVPGKRL
jgi:peptidase M1-like protein